jgi:DNA-binding transcriptional MerR regulator
MDIGEVVRQSGVPASALRYYEERGLIRSTGRSGARRQFGSDVLERLALVALGRAAGLSLDEIGAMLPLDSPPLVDRRLLLQRAGELDRRIRQLTAMRDGLRHAAVCKAADHLSCPTFQRLLRKSVPARDKRRSPDPAP